MEVPKRLAASVCERPTFLPGEQLSHMQFRHGIPVVVLEVEDVAPERRIRSGCSYPIKRFESMRAASFPKSDLVTGRIGRRADRQTPTQARLISLSCAALCCHSLRSRASRASHSAIRTRPSASFAFNHAG
jgi:hypothetical protein